MPSALATILCLAFVLWLFYQDAKNHPAKVSAAIWLPIAWVFIIGSRPISLWFDVGNPSDDKFIDKVAFIFLIVGGLLVLARRKVDWRQIFADNKWLILFYLYLGLSVLWSDYSFVSFKRWFKHFGHLVMVLVVLTEEDNFEAMRLLLVRSAYIMIPLSVLVVKYYPGISRYYDVWDARPLITGITLHKNLLGMTLFVCALPLVWMLLQLCARKDLLARKAAWFGNGIVLLMIIWLLLKAHCATALCCTLFGAALILCFRIQTIRNKVRHLERYFITIALVAFLLQASGLLQVLIKDFAEMVGRDPTLHGRVDIWTTVLKEDINPFLGTGFYSFWSEERNRKLSSQWYYFLGEAHNGYVEMYLNNGLIGLSLFFVALASAARSIKRDVMRGGGFGPLRLVLFTIALMYNVTESTFDRLSIVWFGLLLAMMEIPFKFGLNYQVRSGSDLEDNTDFADQAYQSREAAAENGFAFG